MKMIVVLLALVSAGIFAAHTLDALRARHDAVDFRPLRSAGKDREEFPPVNFQRIGTAICMHPWVRTWN
jgi:hypothetical protein